MSNTIAELSKELTNPNFKKIYEIIADKYNSKGVNDSITEVSFTSDNLKEIQALQFEEVQKNYTQDGIKTQTLDEAKESVIIRVSQDLKTAAEKVQQHYTKDGFYNPLSGIGYTNDPGSYNSSYIPVSMTPDEATSYYTSRGIGANIIDKKSKVPIINGFQFVDGLEPEDLNTLTEHAYRKNFDKALINGLRDGLIYGGSSIVPVFDKDTFETYPLGINDLLRQGILDKNTLSYFISVDRWNMVVVPDFNITAKNYLFPDHFYLPLGSMKVNVKRASIIKPYPLPYWAALRQLGWSISDFEGYIKQLMGYNIVMASIPIMAQQMSLLIHELPLDGIIAQNGAEYAKEFVKENEQRLREWSMVNPKALNSFGKISVIERTYTGFKEIIETYREDIGANCAIPVSNIFMLQAKGMSADNEQDTTLKQSEAIKMIEAELKSQLKPIIQILVIDCFGRNSEQAKKASYVNIDFNSPIVESNADKAESGIKFGNFIGQLVNSGVPLDMAYTQAQQFFPDYEIDEEDLTLLKNRQEEKDEAAKNMLNPIEEEGIEEEGIEEEGIEEEGIEDGERKGISKVLDSMKPVGTVSRRKDGLYKKIDQHRWLKMEADNIEKSKNKKGSQKKSEYVKPKKTTPIKKIGLKKGSKTKKGTVEEIKVFEENGEKIKRYKVAGKWYVASQLK